MTLNIIVAADKHNGIGKDGNLPWYIPGEMARFKKITTRVVNKNNINVVIMGRITHESIGHTLPDRINIVISNTLNQATDLDIPNDIIIKKSLCDAIDYVTYNIPNVENIFIIGGERLYKDAMDNHEIDRIYLTRINKVYECDRFLHIIDQKKFKITYYEPYEVIEYIIYDNII